MYERVIFRRIELFNKAQNHILCDKALKRESDGASGCRSKSFPSLPTSRNDSPPSSPAAPSSSSSSSSPSPTPSPSPSSSPEPQQLPPIQPRESARSEPAPQRRTSVLCSARTICEPEQDKQQPPLSPLTTALPPAVSACTSPIPSAKSDPCGGRSTPLKRFIFVSKDSDILFGREENQCYLDIQR